MCCQIPDARFGASLPTHPIGQQRPVECSAFQSFKRQLRSESCLSTKASKSAITAIGLRRSIGQQSAAYLPFHLEWSRTAASISGECVLRSPYRPSSLLQTRRSGKPWFYGLDIYKAAGRDLAQPAICGRSEWLSNFNSCSFLRAACTTGIR